ncbi:MAG TPA: flagellar filament capping protein FliD [Woeseiaceae bacterium]|nr:flagellar filament capping protein FliD [Woeseiaceae bacterium]
MPSIVSTGIGSGLDIAGIVQSLVTAEGAPLETRIGQKEARAQARLSAFGSLKSALSDFRDKLDAMKTADKFLVRTATSSDEDAFSASASGKALPAAYDVEVVQLATAHKLTSGAFTGSGAVVGTGTLLVGLGPSVAAIEITEQNNTLAGIRDAINASSDNPGVSATIVNADSGSYIILTSDTPGTANSITVQQTGGDGGLGALTYDPLNANTQLTESTAAGDARVRIDGLDVVGSSNSIEGAIEGITLEIKAITEGPAAKLRIENDQSAAHDLVTDFVESYNSLINTLDGLSDYSPESSSAGPLLGDASVRNIRDQVRREMSNAVTAPESSFATLRDVGIETQLDGTLVINESELTDALDSEFAKFGMLFAAGDGFAVRLHTLADGFLGSGGIVETRSQGLQTQIEGLSEQRDSLNERLEALETRLLRQFNALDSLLAQLSSTSNFLNQQLSSLPGVERVGQ